MLETKGLAVRGGEFLVQDVSFRILPGHIHALLGPTGNGKTLLLEGIAGLRPIVQGRVFIDGNDVTPKPPEQRGIGYVPQDLALFPNLSVMDNVLFASRVRGCLDEGARLRAVQLMARLGIEALAERWPHSLSGGERQRVALARALSSGNRLLLLDEPFASLNEGLRRELWMSLKDLQREMGLSILMVTHDLEEAFFLADQVSVIIDGTIQQTAAKDQLYRRPATVGVAEYLGIRNLFPGTVLSHSKERWEVQCPGLSTSLMVDDEASPSEFHSGSGDRVVVAIRSDEVKVLRPDLPHTESINQFTGHVRAIYNKGAILSLVFQPMDARQTVELEIARRTMDKLKLEVDGKATITFKPGQLFLLPAISEGGIEAKSWT